MKKIYNRLLLISLVFMVNTTAAGYITIYLHNETDRECQCHAKALFGDLVGQHGHVAVGEASIVCGYPSLLENPVVKTTCYCGRKLVVLKSAQKNAMIGALPPELDILFQNPSLNVTEKHVYKNTYGRTDWFENCVVHWRIQ